MMFVICGILTAIRPFIIQNGPWLIPNTENHATREPANGTVRGIT